MSQLPLAASWFLAIMMVAAAIIDGRELRVPNRLTYPLALAGLAASAAFGGFSGLLGGLEGLILGLALLIPLYAIGGMGAGDVKLLAAAGAWVGPWHIVWAFVATGIVGGLMAAVMIARSGAASKHRAQFVSIAGEIAAIRDPSTLSAIAAERKPRMLLLPYGIPMAVGSIAYFAYAGLLGTF